MIQLPQLFDNVDIYALPLSGTGRAAERKAVDELFREALGTAAGHHADGAPYAIGCEELAVSVSHGAGMAVLGVCRIPGTSIGIDIESSGRSGQLKRVEARFVSSRDSRDLSLLHIWTAKEAVYKACRRPGLSLTDITVISPSAATALGRSLSLVWHPMPDALLCIARM